MTAVVLGAGHIPVEEAAELRLAKTSDAVVSFPATIWSTRG